ncbi:hypothetical protein THRCLA_11413 [Thraustotheca clavata]|uniref:Uncharacterized protein n=1 Tax=Thraustotheca clavata TaxID=74557 RepID=A0A1V9Y7S5_9STRA|nr:hypothetical protein THRCLA_11413 [Thraustotheca clavata]
MTRFFQWLINLWPIVINVDLNLLLQCMIGWSLDCWASDAYVAKYHLPTTSNCQQHGYVANDIYTLRLILIFDYLYCNPHFNKRPWNGKLANPKWLCALAGTIRKQVQNRKILGGGVGYDMSQYSQYFKCSTLDVVAIHSYEGANKDKLQNAVKLANAYKKRIIFEEFGGSGGSKASSLAAYTEAANSLGLPWMFWEILKPGNPSDLETWVDEKDAWGTLSNAAKKTQNIKGAWQWPELN